MISSQEVCDRAGCSYRQLDYWDRQGVIAPIRPALGNGTRRGWGRYQVATVALLADLAALGANGAVLRVVAARAEALEPAEWDGTAFVDKRGRMGPVRTDRACWSVNLARYRVIAEDRVQLELAPA